MSLRLAIAIAATSFAGGASALADEPYCTEPVRGATHCLNQRLRDGEMVTEREKVDLRGLEGEVAELVSTKEYACVRTYRGRVYCWGSNYAGRLGIGGVPVYQPVTEDGDWWVAAATPPIPFPTKPVADIRFLSVSVNDSTTAAMSEDGADNVYVWGRIFSVANLQENEKAFAEATSSVPVRLDLSTLPEKRVEGLVAGALGAFGWTRSGVIYAFGGKASGPTPHRLMKVPDASLVKGLKPVGYSVEVETTAGTYAPQESGTFKFTARVPRP